MFANYFKIALRTLAKHKGYAFINIAGLAVGMACCLLILLYVQHELSYDRYHEKADHLYRVTFFGTFGGDHLHSAAVAAPTAEALANDYPDVLHGTRLYTPNPQRSRLRHGDQSFVETRVVFADAGLFDVFTIPLLKGDPRTALAEPNTMVISEAMAQKYFGDDAPLGKTLTLNAAMDYTVTGVFEEIPGNTHFHYDFFASLTTLDESRHPGWLNNMAFRTYLVLREEADPRSLEAQFPDMVNTYMPEFAQRYNLRYGLQRVTDIHLTSDLAGELEPNGDRAYVYVFSAIALFILIIACINFMNLSTARSANRAREVGIRKVVGSSRSQLIAQFLAESVIMSFIALVFAVILAKLALPAFNSIAGKELVADDLANGVIGFSLTALVVFVGLLAGSYPALVLSSFKPVAVLKQQRGVGLRGQWMRSGLVVFQFAASITLIIGAVVVQNQMAYVQNKKLGFERDHVLIIHDATILASQAAAFKGALLQNPSIVSASATGYLPVTSTRTEDVVQPEGRYREDGTVLQKWTIDVDYVETMGMAIVEGRDFSRAFPTDSFAVIVNEAAVEHFGWENPVGKHLRDLVSVDPDAYVDFPVIGVVEDFHYESLRDRIGPLALFLGSNSDLVSLRLTTDNLSSTIAWIEDTWEAFAPGQPFAYSFLDERFSAMYQAEQRTGTIFGLFAALAIFIGCLGLLGLAAYTAERRTKEIGVRKVMGASVSGIILLLSRDFAKWVLLANVVAWPVSYIVMSRWLEAFSYRTSMGWGTFVTAGLAVLVLALLSVSYQAIRTALANPVKALRHE